MDVDVDTELGTAVVDDDAAETEFVVDIDTEAEYGDPVTDLDEEDVANTGLVDEDEEEDEDKGGSLAHALRSTVWPSWSPTAHTPSNLAPLPA